MGFKMLQITFIVYVSPTGFVPDENANFLFIGILMARLCLVSNCETQFSHCQLNPQNYPLVCVGQYTVA